MCMKITLPYCLYFCLLFNQCVVQISLFPQCVMYTHCLPSVASPSPVMVRSEVTHWDPGDFWPANTHFSSARTSPLAPGSYSLSLVRSVGRKMSFHINPLMRQGPGTPVVFVSLWSGVPVLALPFFLAFVSFFFLVKNEGIHIFLRIKSTEEL